MTLQLLRLGLAASTLLGAGAASAQTTASFDAAREQARQSGAVQALQAADERRAETEQARARAAGAKPGDAEAARKTAEARARTPEGFREAQAEADRDEAQPRVLARAAATRRALAVQPDETGRTTALRVDAAGRQVRSEARTSVPALDLGPR